MYSLLLKIETGHDSTWNSGETYLHFSPMGVKHSGEGIYGCRSHNAKLFEQIEHSGIR